MFKVDKNYVTLGDITLLYVDVEGIMSFQIIPTSLKDKITDDKFNMEYIRKNGFTHVRNDPMVQLSLLGDTGEKEFYAGNSMLNSSSSYEFKFVNQNILKDNGKTEVVTIFDNGKGQLLENHIVKYDSANAVESFNVLKNNGEKDITVEMITSFNINSISPFTDENNVDNIILHRLRTAWSAEGKLESFTATELQLEDPWSSYGIRQARIGQVGSMPCRTHMPFYAIEDRDANCTWAVSLEAPMSWHIDATHHQTSISLSGGIADFESGHFRKVIKPNEEYRTYSGFITAVEGGLELATQTLQEIYVERLNIPAIEEDLPLIYNEYCCSWGNPCIGNLKPMIDECARLGIKEFVVDVGWWRPDERSWYTFGDWNPSPILFPNGISELSSYIRSKGMIPGIWFEFEGVSSDSILFNTHSDYMLTRDGFRIQHRERSLLDFRKPEVVAYVREKVLKLLKDNHFGYVKIDYNEPIGVGCDGAESYGEGMRQHLECVMDFFKEIKREIPDLIIEVCSSGGHRLEPKFLSLGSMASFSDAHLGLEGAVVACDLHRYMLPRQMQIWAVIEPHYSLARVYFTMVKGMVGRYCLSGDLLQLTPDKKSAVESSIPFYDKIKDIIKNGKTLVNVNDGVTSLRHLHGTRYIVRYSKDGKKAVLWVFSFNGDKSLTITNDCFKGYTITDSFLYGSVEKVNDNQIKVTQTEKDTMLSAVVVLEK